MIRAVRGARPRRARDGEDVVADQKSPRAAETVAAGQPEPGPLLGARGGGEVGVRGRPRGVERQDPRPHPRPPAPGGP